MSAQLFVCSGLSRAVEQSLEVRVTRYYNKGVVELFQLLCNIPYTRGYLVGNFDLPNRRMELCLRLCVGKTDTRGKRGFLDIRGQ